MNTDLATKMATEVASTTDEQSLILPTKREALLKRLNQLKINNLSAREFKDYKLLREKSSYIFAALCWSNFGISEDQLKKMEQHDLDELAVMIYEQSKATAIIHTIILMCIPVIGWLVLLASLEYVTHTKSDYWNNLRYYWWYKRMKNKYGQDFKPIVAEPIVQKEG